MVTVPDPFKAMFILLSETFELSQYKPILLDVFDVSAIYASGSVNVPILMDVAVVNLALT